MSINLLLQLSRIFNTKLFTNLLFYKNVIFSDIDECVGTVCGDMANQCLNNIGKYSCVCANGFYGVNVGLRNELCQGKTSLNLCGIVNFLFGHPQLLTYRIHVDILSFLSVFKASL